jgi:glycosyltransferase involved in cell wall biosynthesis
MKLLAVLRFNPFPPRAGSAIVAYNSLKYLSEYHDIDFLCLKNVKEKIEIPEFFKNTEFVYQESNLWILKVLRITFYMFLGIPPFVSEFISKKMKRRVKEVIENGKFDAILLFEMNAIQYCPSSYYGKIIVNIEDVQSLRSSRMAMLKVMSFWQKIRKLVYAKITESYEKKILPQMCKVILLSESDMREMQKNREYDNIGFMPYGVDSLSIKNVIDFEKRTEGMIVLSGNMFHPPNVDGALYFLNKIFPLVLENYSNAVLWIVGADPDKRIKKAAEFFGEHVVITGRVNDMSDYLKRARVSVCPVKLKIGVQTKILEALSCGTPVVTTSAGNSGVGGISGKELWVEDKPDIFANRVVSFLRGENWYQFSNSGRELVEKKFSWKNSVEQLNQYIKVLN